MNSIFDNDSVNIIDKYGIFYTRFKVIHSEFQIIYVNEKKFNNKKINVKKIIKILLYFYLCAILK